MNELESLRKKVRELEECRKSDESTLASLKESENQYKAIFNRANDGIILHDFKGNIIDVNETMYKRLGYTKEEMLAMRLDGIVVPDFSPLIQERVEKLKEDGLAVFESGDRRKDGSVIPVEVSARIVDFQGEKIIQSVVRDISYRRMAEDLVQSTREERELAREVLQWRSRYCAWFHGRLVDYLSLLQDDEKKAKLIQAVYERIQTMVFIEDRIYRSLSFRVIEMAPIIRGLTSYLHSHHRVGLKNVRIEQNLEGIHLDIKRAVFCALIINEMVSNTLIHAFQEEAEGKIEVRMNKEGRGYRLSVRDNGVGLPGGFDLEKQDSMGMWIIRELVDSLGGELHFGRDSGTEFAVVFD